MVDDEEDEEPLEADQDMEGDTEEKEDFTDDEVHMSARGRGSSQSSRGRGRGRGRAAPSSEHTPSPSPSTSTPGTSQVAPTIPPPAAPSPQLNADSSHASQPDPLSSKSKRLPSPKMVRRDTPPIIEYTHPQNRLPWIPFVPETLSTGG
ncbi:hypothetical protein PIB30_090634 [Stylosanthes scabra]|uniref:Uncharacterized protein n=1 Tax=Stylosanthes scabra TaxID=79078 RepID=A0ABU6QUH7_9FABA|nr:hypothetical protein [Stylosanthes scabra]